MGGASGNVIWMCLSVFPGHFLELSSQWHFQDFCNHQLSLSTISEGSCKGEGNLSLEKPRHIMSDVISAFTAGQEDFIIGTLGYSWGKTHPENTKNKAEGKEKRQGQRKEKKVEREQQVEPHILLSGSVSWTWNTHFKIV